MARKIAATTLVDGGLEVSWSEREAGRYPGIWLRDNCSCASCRHPNGQRLFEIGDLPARPEIQGAMLGADGVVSVIWRDGHTSRFSEEFLSQHELFSSAQTARCANPIYWGSEIAGHIPSEDWARLNGDESAELAWLERFHAYGFALIRNVPTKPGMVTEVGDRLGYVRNTNYGRHFEVVSVPNPNNLAYTALGLGVHSDNPYRDPTPGIQLLHCLVSDAPGGDTLLVDGFAAAETLRREDSAALEVLATVPASFRFTDENTDLQARRPLIEVDFEGRIKAVHFNNRSITTLDVDSMWVEPWYDAYRKFAAILKRPDRELVFRLAAGDLIVMQNERALHGRTAFDPNLGRRHLQGCYVDKDGLESRLRVLRRKAASNKDQAA